MKLDKKTLLSRILMIVLCFVIFLTCYERMNESFDPLARYPYATSENRDIILHYLNEDDINYIINQQIEPEKFMDFIEIDGFNVHNTMLYYNAKKTQDAENEYIVNFVNRYRAHLTNATIVDMTSNYSYLDLTNFFETESVLNDGLKLVSNPSQPLLILDSNHSVYKYVPENLVEFQSIKIQESMKKNLTSMLNAYEKTMGASFVVSSGYSSYEDIMNQYVNFQEQFPQNVQYIVNIQGEEETQLGYTIVLEKSLEWLNLCQEYNVFETYDYDQMIQDSGYNMELIEWLEENAYRYGFIIRYPAQKEEWTHRIFQPYVLRYVGKKNAKKLQKSGDCLEQASLTKLE